MRSRAAGLALGYAADRLLGDPPRLHPVAGFGALAARAERTWYADDRARGVLHVVVLVTGASAVGLLADRATRDHPTARTLATAAATWTVLGGRSLEREAAAVAAHLEAGDLVGARLRLTHLVGRDTANLSTAEVARAVVESVAENSSDAVVAPLLLGALGGMPALLGYRAANTLDAMVGHRSDRYRRFGWAAARFDDLLNLPGARLAAALAVALGDDPGGALRAWRRDAHRHPSPNAGPVEAAFAGALGVRLGGTNSYGSAVEDRGFLGTGRPVAPPDIARANRLARRVGLGAAVVATGVATVVGAGVAISLAARPRPPRRRAC